MDFKELVVKALFTLNSLSHIFLLSLSLSLVDKIDLIIISFTEIGLIYDNFVLLFGSLLQENTLRTLSYPRYFMHGVILPFLYFVLMKYLKTFSNFPYFLEVGLYLAVPAMSYLGFKHYTELELIKKESVGITSMKSKNPPSLFPVISLIFFGIYVGILAYSRISRPELIVGCLIMFFLAAVPGQYRDVVSNIGEVFFMGGIIYALR